MDTAMDFYIKSVCVCYKYGMENNFWTKCMHINTLLFSIRNEEWAVFKPWLGLQNNAIVGRLNAESKE